MSIIRIETSADCYLGFAKKDEPAPVRAKMMALPSKSVTYFDIVEGEGLVVDPWSSFRSYKFIQSPIT